MNGGSGNKGPIPPRWLKCPRKSVELVGRKFLALKTPLDSSYDDQVAIENRFYPEMVFGSMKSYKVKIGLWVDLTNTSRFYYKGAIEKHECRYVKLQCRGHGETPSTEQVQAFISICRKFAQQNPLEIIAVHCTHGFNRSGFMIASYLIETEDWSPEASIAAFARARPPGIYKQDYLTELFKRYGDPEDTPQAPELPDWCYDSETGVDEDGNLVEDPTQSSPASANGNKRNRKAPVFMDGVPGVRPVEDERLIRDVQNRVRNMCKFRHNGFPGSQPVSMDRENIQMLARKPYWVSWKADGTRYMMLIDGKNRHFFIDRDNNVFQISNLTFLDRKDETKHIQETLLDGEMVIDHVGDERFPRYLIYDIVKFKGVNVGEGDFGMRMLCIDKEIVGARVKYIMEGKINKSTEPFSIRKKQFWDVGETRTLLGPKFTKESLGHEPDGLIFQPFQDPYKPGRDDNVLKWKPSSHNSVDFKLVIVKEDRPGMCVSSIGRLYVGGLNSHYGEIKVTKSLRQYDNKIIECTLENNQWKFMRERTDKSFPNAFATAEGVMKSIREPVTEEILTNFVEHHRWKKQKMPPPPPPPAAAAAAAHPPPKRPRM